MGALMSALATPASAQQATSANFAIVEWIQAQAEPAPMQSPQLHVRTSFATLTAGEALSLDFRLSASFLTDDFVGSNGVSFCSGDGSLPTACPCANAGAAGRGCANSVASVGAMLIATGSTVRDTLRLQASSVPPTASVSTIFLQSDGTAAGGTVFGDGIACLAGTLIRIGSGTAPNGSSLYPEPGRAPISVRGQVQPGSGAVRYYQAYYRNAAAIFCPPATFNITNGVIVVW